MTSKPTKARANADRAAAMLSRMMAEPEAVAPEPVAETPIGAASDEPEPEPEPEPAKRPPGRPKGKREVAARHTLNLDARRQDALQRMAEDRGRSIHSLLLEAVDLIIGKPQAPGWTP